MTLSSEDREAIRRARKVIQDHNRLKRAALKASRAPRVQKAGQAPRVRDNAHLARVRRLPCIATLVREGREVYGVDAAHVRASYPERWWGGNPGLAAKPDDWRTLPLLRAEHVRQHAMNEKAFWSDLGVYPPIVCRALRDAPDFDAMLTAIRTAAAIAREDRR